MNDILKKLAHLSPEKRKLVLKKLKDQGLSRERVAPIQIPIAPRPELIPLSYSQFRMWMMMKLTGKKHVAANMNIPVRCRGHLNIAVLKKSLNEIVRRHEILRATFVERDQKPWMKLHDKTEIPILQIDLRAFEPGRADPLAISLLMREKTRLFNLEKCPLALCILIYIGPEETILFFNVHHLLGDAWSMANFSREFMVLYEAFYRGATAPLPDLPIQFVDYAAWQKDWLQGEVLDRQLGYWRGQLKDAAEPLKLPVDRAPIPGQPPYRSSIPFRLEQPVVEQLQRLAQAEDASLYMLMVAAFQTLLHRYSGQRYINIGALIAGRNQPQTQDLIGLFINTLVLRVDLGGNPSFRELLKRAREVTLNAYANQDLPFEHILEDLKTKRALMVPTLFQVMVVLQNIPLTEIKMPNLTIHSVEQEEPGGFSTAEITLLLVETETGFKGLVGYNPFTFDRGTIEIITGHFVTFLRNICRDPDQTIEDISILTAEERTFLVETLNRSPIQSGKERSVEVLFEQRARLNPDSPALFFGDERLTYAELNARANRLAHVLRERGIRPDNRIAVIMNRNPALITAILAVLKAGGAYLPLDPNLPRDRVKIILADAGPSVILTESSLVDRFRGETTPTLVPDGADAPTVAAASTANPPSIADPENLAYMIYTSGSTGRPKGVNIPRRALARYTRESAQIFELTAADRVLQFASLSFDTAAEEIFPCFWVGAGLVLRDEAMLQSAVAFGAFCQRMGVTMIDLPTAFWHTMVAQLNGAAIPDGLRLIILGGEKVSVEKLNAWRAAPTGHARLLNTYGPTEATIVATLYDLSAKDAATDRAPIGKPAPGTHVYVLSERMHPLPVAAPGELFIGGDRLARGYERDPALSAQRFLPDPFSGETGARLYRTGDRVRFLPGGDLEFLERIDFQVKIRGFRVELGEIENAIGGHPSVAETVVVVRTGNDETDLRLAAYLVARGELDLAALREELREKLPDYMMPASFTKLDDFPRTAGGKINRAALPDPDSGSTGQSEFVPPETEIEIAVADIWQEVLAVEKVGLFDNFFDLGGNSLLSTQVLYMVQERFAVGLSLYDLFEDPTVGNLALLIEERLIEELEEQ